MNVTLFKTSARDSLVRKCLYHFENGLRKRIKNFDVLPDEKYKACQVAAMFGVYSKKHHNLTLPRKKILELNKNVLVIERGFVKRNDGYQSIGWNGNVGFGEYCNQNMPPDRWKKLNVELLPQKKIGDSIVIMGQIPWDTAVQNIDYRRWVITIAEILKKITDRPIIFRPHPLKKTAIPPIKGVETSHKSLQEDLNRARVCVLFNSTSGVEAIIDGTPVIAMDKGSMVWDLTKNKLSPEAIETPYFPDDKKRQQWANDIAYAQWHFDEIERGDFWEHIKQGFQNEL